jgi:hypothetical protein
MSMLLIHSAYPSNMYLLHVHSVCSCLMPMSICRTSIMHFLVTCAFCISGLHAHVTTACPCCMSCPCCKSCLMSFKWKSAWLLTIKCCLSLLLVHADCPCCMSVLHVRAECLCCISYACLCCISLLLVHAACPCYTSVLNVHAACPCGTPMHLMHV